jgi:hypothetical protein
MDVARSVGATVRRNLGSWGMNEHGGEGRYRLDRDIRSLQDCQLRSLGEAERGEVLP